jgi:hypothetical protein
MSIDMRVFIENRSKFPLDELEKYAGRWVAWSGDGTIIVASSSESDEAVYDQVVAAGLNPSEHVFGYVPGPDETFI